MSLPLPSKFMKYLLAIFNFIFVLTGLILVIVGGVIQASYNNYSHILDGGFFSVPVLLIVVGTIIFVVSFFGCCGAFKENYCMTVTFCACLILIFILELSAGIAGYLLRDRVTDVLEKELVNSMRDYNTSKPIHDMWDDAQHEFKCCGGQNGFEDWINTTAVIPPSCCDEPVNGTCSAPSVQATPTPNTAYSKKCFESFENLLKRNGAVLGGIGIGIAIIQLLGVIFACNLASSIRKDYESV